MRLSGRAADIWQDLLVCRDESRLQTNLLICKHDHVLSLQASNVRGLGFFMGWEATSICMAVPASSVRCYTLQYIADSCLNYVVQVSSASAAQHDIAATGSQAEKKCNPLD